MSDHLRIVVVEDCPLLRTALVDQLSNVGDLMVVAAMPDARQLTTIVDQQRPDVVVLDLHLHPLGEITADNTIAVIERCTSVFDTRVIAYSASESVSRITSALSAGASGFVSKRQPIEDLITAIRRVAAGERSVSAHLAGDLIAAVQAPGGDPGLTAVEVTIVTRLAEGATDTEIAQELFVSRRTIQNRLATIRARTGLSRREEITKWAIDNDWITSRM